MEETDGCRTYEYLQKNGDAERGGDEIYQPLPAGFIPPPPPPSLSSMPENGDAELMDISMNSLVERVLPFRTSKYIEDLREKMLGEGIAAPADLLRVSKDALEMKLSTHADFNFIEMADAISLRSAIDKTGSNSDSLKPAHARSRSPRRGGRSRNHDNFRGDGTRNFNGGRGGSRRGSKPKPELWAAVERNDEALVQQLLARDKDIEERFEGWTPCMKAAEEGAVEAMRMLLDKKADIDAINPKGRTALSFAAAPSNDGTTRRPTPVSCLRLLLERGADAKRKDKRGISPKDYAIKDKRDDAIAVLQEFGF